MKKVLFISHFFPPLGGAGVQRSAKFVKHLPSFGWLPLVLTGEGKSVDRWTPEDQSLMRDVPEVVRVFRAVSPLGGSRRQRKTLRRQAYLDLGHQIIREHSPQLIFVTMSPFGDAAIASELAATHGLPWVADLRDPWALDEFQVYPTRWHRMFERSRMKRALATASLIIMNTPEAAARLRTAFPSLASRAQASITNGFDEEDFSGDVPPRNTHRFTIVHSGYFHAELGLRQQRRAFEFRLLGRSEPGVDFLPRSHFYLLQAMERWRQSAPDIVDNVRVVCLGAATKTDYDLLQRSTVGDFFEFTGYLPHVECLKRVRAADLLFLPMHKLRPGRRATIVPGKTYEYMASGKPILAALPEGDARDFVTAAGTGVVIEPDNIEKMHQALQSQYSEWRAGKSTLVWDESYVQQFSRRRLTARLAEQFERVAERWAASTRKPDAKFRHRDGKTLASCESFPFNTE